MPAIEPFAQTRFSSVEPLRNPPGAPVKLTGPWQIPKATSTE
jgi:hypothetical protein